jgi:ubiquinone/menaquinone biosynthesis C-methylase UbiE
MDTPALVAVGVALALLAYFVWQRRSPSPFPPWMTPILHAPYRRRYFSPERAAERHGLAPGMRVLEVGPGDGYLTGTALERIAPGGRLVCLDVQLAMLRKLRAALGGGTPPLVCASGSLLPFRSGAFDLVFLVHVLGEIPDRAGALADCARCLRAGGTLAVTEGLPDPDFIRGARLLRMAAAVGLRPAQRFGGRLHYTQRFERPSAAAAAP